MVSLMNGLSALGTGVSAFAGTAALEYQKSQLANQSAILADQLATTRETTLQGQKQTFEAGENVASRAATASNTAALIAGRATDVATEQAGAGARTAATIAGTAANTAAVEAAATARNNAVIAAAAPEQQQRILDQQQATALAKVQTKNAQDLSDARTALQTETGKPDADPTKIASLKSQVTTLETSATTEAATTTAAAGMYRTDMDNVTSLNTRLVAATTALNSPEMTETAKAQQQGVINDLKLQLAGAQRALEYSSALVHGRVGAATNTPQPTAPAAGPRPPLSSFQNSPAGATPPASNTAVGPGVAGSTYDPQTQTWSPPKPGFVNQGASR